jgi:predicted  nucleic acid-binding Zn-ribbon protein
MKQLQKSGGVSIKGQKGFFISLDQFQEVDRMFNQVMNSGLERRSPEELIKLNEEIQQLRARTQAAELELTSLKKEASSKAATLKELETARLEAESAFKTKELGLKALRNEMQQDLIQAQKDASAARAELEKVRHGFDPDAAVEADNEKRKLAARVTELNRSLQEVNQQLKDERAKVLAVGDKEAEVRRALAEHKKLVESMEAAKAEMILRGMPNMKEPLRVNAEWVKAALGDKGLQWLSKAVEQEPHAIRERVYDLMLASKSGKTKLFKGLTLLLQEVFDWVKASGHKTRLVIKEWLDELQSDLANGTMKNLKYYREKLEAVVKHLRAKAREVREKATNLASGYVPASWTWWDEAKSKARNAFLLGKSFVKKTARKVGSFFSRPKAAVKSFWLERQKAFYRPYYETMLRLHMQKAHVVPITGCPMCDMKARPAEFVKNVQWVQTHFPDLISKYEAKAAAASCTDNGLPEPDQKLGQEFKTPGPSGKAN